MPIVLRMPCSMSAQVFPDQMATSAANAVVTSRGMCGDAPNSIRPLIRAAIRKAITSIALPKVMGLIINKYLLQIKSSYEFL
ncbi:MAG: hypothetical protein ACD_39C00567G0001 [uncultured bacterium]|nr:MAG: hypothetical protein ACD_39C00567G0001 [uncultured bacterium]